MSVSVNVSKRLNTLPLSGIKPPTTAAPTRLRTFRDDVRCFIGVAMKKLSLLLLLGLELCSGCAQHYIVTLNNGTQIGTTSKPHLKDNAYIYKDMRGQETAMPAGRVREIAPASMVKQPKNSL